MPKQHHLIIQHVSKYSPYTVNLFAVTPGTCQMELAYSNSAVYDLKEEVLELDNRFEIAHFGIAADEVHALKIRATLHTVIQRYLS